MLVLIAYSIFCLILIGLVVLFTLVLNGKKIKPKLGRKYIIYVPGRGYYNGVSENGEIQYGNDLDNCTEIHKNYIQTIGELIILKEYHTGNDYGMKVVEEIKRKLHCSERRKYK